MERGVRDFVTAYNVCARGKASCQAPSPDPSLTLVPHRRGTRVNALCFGCVLQSLLRLPPTDQWAADWTEAHNPMTSSATGRSPFEATLGYQPPLFPEQEKDIAVPSVKVSLCHCCQIWIDTRAALLQTSDAHKRVADKRRTPAPAYRLGQQLVVH